MAKILNFSENIGQFYEKMAEKMNIFNVVMANLSYFKHVFMYKSNS